MDYTEITGFAAALLTTISNIPQALKIIRTRETKDVSAVTYLILFCGLLLWIGYGILRHDLPLIFANIISALVCGIILFLKIVSKKVLDNIHHKVHE